MNCPKCDSSNYDFGEDWFADGPRENNKWYTVSFRCNDCGTVWYEEYKHTGSYLKEDLLRYYLGENLEIPWRNDNED